MSAKHRSSSQLTGWNCRMLRCLCMECRLLPLIERSTWTLDDEIRCSRAASRNHEPQHRTAVHLLRRGDQCGWWPAAFWTGSKLSAITTMPYCILTTDCHKTRKNIRNCIAFKTSKFNTNNRLVFVLISGQYGWVATRLSKKHVKNRKMKLIYQRKKLLAK